MKLHSKSIDTTKKLYKLGVQQYVKKKFEKDLGNIEHVSETRFENEEKDLVMAFSILTLKYKNSLLEEGFYAHIGRHELLIVEVILSILSILLIYLYFTKDTCTSIIMGIIIVIILIQYSEYYPKTLPAFILFISTCLIFGGSISHLIKILITILSISIYLPLIIFTKQISTSIIVDLCVCRLISLIVLYGISRHVEVVRRYQYRVVHKSSEQRIEIEKERDRANWLLRNILPKHAIEPLRLHRGSYSHNHPCVGVLFASLINYHVMYEEQYEGGKFYLRILNDFYGDIEELFLDPRFSEIEKIKTIGTTFMAASGLQTDENDQNPLGSVCDLVEFALAFETTMNRFNETLLSFAFEL
ncbi:unnamed protein product [Rotaria sp. Silwood2]|nr:unnamed protein product [Rotaria sp. Silwood2]CAF2833693.1 unnamed protein product [Rotaria sp. Silwood2]CAF4168210.1 unnamed protein product [Rotaria sp. Silwood2]CAF4326142.1 unnamed protein product [Rotaria sp. Silwood2]